MAAQNILVVARELRGATQRKLASDTGVSTSRIQRMEQPGGIDATPAGQLLRVAEVLDLDVGGLCSGQKDKWANELAAHFLQLDAWQSLPEIMARCARSLRRYRPEVAGLGVMVPDAARRDYTLYYGGMHAGSAATTPRGRDSGAEEMMERLHVDVGMTDHYTAAAPHLCTAATWRPLWLRSQLSHHGAVLVYCVCDPTRVGDCDGMVQRLTSIVDRGIDLLLAIAQRDNTASLNDLERRLRALESHIRRSNKSKSRN